MNSNIVNSYSGFRSFRPMTNRERVRYITLSLLSLGNFMRKVDDNSITFLAFHYLFPDNQSAFRKLLQQLSGDFKFISLSEGVERVHSSNITGRSICFTCDDGFSNFESAATILEEFGATACVFVCPAFTSIDNPQDLAFYNKDRLGGPPVEFLTWSDMERLKVRGHEIGNHTFSHKNLGKLSDSEIQEEIEAATDHIWRELGECEHFACPYGYDAAFNDFAVDTVYQLGHKSFFTTTRGCHKSGEVHDPNGSDRLLFRRQHFEPFWPLGHSTYFIHR